MAQLKFQVKHFVACEGISWYGGSGPKPPFTLEEVGYYLNVRPFSEPPFDIPAIWLYLRMFTTSRAAGKRVFSIRVYRVLANGREDRIFSFRPAPIIFRQPVPEVYEKVWTLRDIRLPAYGLYAIRLYCKTRSWAGWKLKRLAVEYFNVRRTP